MIPGSVEQSVMCLATDTCLTANPRVSSLIIAWSHTFVEIDHEIIPTVILLPSADNSRRFVVSYSTGKPLFKLAQEKVWLGELTVPP